MRNAFRSRYRLAYPMIDGDLSLGAELVDLESLVFGRLFMRRNAYIGIDQRESFSVFG